MSIATIILNQAISYGAVKHQIAYISLWADNIFNDEIHDRVIFQFDCGNCAITLCTKTWVINSVKHFDSLFNSNSLH